MAARLSGVRFFESRFAEAGDGERAVWEKKYMKSELRFHGVTSAVMRASVREHAKTHRDETRGDVIALVEALYATDWFDLHGAAVLLLARRAKLLEPSDAPWLLELVRRSSCWAHVDPLATDVVGALVTAHPDLLRSLPTWARDEHVWVRRTALLAQLRELRAGRGDFDLFVRIAVPLLPDRSFWIRKAIGWVLRDVSRKRPELVREVLRAHGDAMSGVTRREAVKYV